MRKQLLGQIAVLLLAAPSLFAQSPLATSLPDADDRTNAAVTGSPPDVVPDAAPLPPRVWGDVEYLLWWIKSGPLATPLVTTSTDNPLTPQSGALGQSGTRVLFGENRLDYGAFSGLRAGAGAWIDSGCLLGLEANGLVLEQRSVRFSVQSDATGTPLLALPYRTPAGKESMVTITIPAVGGNPPLIGGAAVSSTSNLDGAEANGIINLIRQGGLSTDLVAGFRFASLDEDLQVASNSLANLGSFGSLSTSTWDRFDTQNRFAGGQIGSRLGYITGRLSIDIFGRVALGSTHQVVNASGSTAFNGTGNMAGLLPATTDGGVFAQPSNIGRLTHDEFTVVPEMQLRFGIGLTSAIHTYVGYNFLYWSSVVRPGDQIDRTVNPLQSILLGGTGLLSGSSRPSGPFGQTDMWAQGLSLGVELGW